MKKAPGTSKSRTSKSQTPRKPSGVASGNRGSESDPWVQMRARRMPEVQTPVTNGAAEPQSINSSARAMDVQRPMHPTIQTAANRAIATMIRLDAWTKFGRIKRIANRAA